MHVRLAFGAPHRERCPSHADRPSPLANADDQPIGCGFASASDRPPERGGRAPDPVGTSIATVPDR